jgi:hypothetical protein
MWNNTQNVLSKLDKSDLSDKSDLPVRSDLFLALLRLCG